MAPPASNQLLHHSYEAQRAKTVYLSRLSRSFIAVLTASSNRSYSTPVCLCIFWKTSVKFLCRTPLVLDLCDNISHIQTQYNSSSSTIRYRWKIVIPFLRVRTHPVLYAFYKRFHCARRAPSTVICALPVPFFLPSCLASALHRSICISSRKQIFRRLQQALHSSPGNIRTSVPER